MGFSSLDVACYILWPVTGASKHHDDDSTVLHRAGAVPGPGDSIVGSIVRWRWAHELQIIKNETTSDAYGPETPRTGLRCYSGQL